MQYLDAISKMTEWSLFVPRQTNQYHTNPTLCPDQKRWRSWTVLWRPTRLSRINTQNRCPFHFRGLEGKSRKLRNTWGNRRIWPWSTEWSRVKANRVLPRECTGHGKHPLPTTQEKTLHMDITRWSTPKSDWLYSLKSKMERLYIVSKNKTWSWQWLRSWAPYCKTHTYIEGSRENHQAIQVRPKSNPLYSGGDQQIHYHRTVNAEQSSPCSKQGLVHPFCVQQLHRRIPHSQPIPSSPLLPLATTHLFPTSASLLPFHR